MIKIITMRFFGWIFLFLIFGLFSNHSFVKTPSIPHTDHGKLLDFDATNFDAGTLYIGDDVSPYFSFVNRTDAEVRIKAVSANNGSYRDPFRLVKIDTNNVIKPGEHDTIFFERYFNNYAPNLGNYDLSFTVKFMNSDVQQYINIFCILKENGGVCHSPIGAIGPDQNNVLSVSYPIKTIGPFSRTIVVYHSASETPIILTFKGVIL